MIDNQTNGVAIDELIALLSTILYTHDPFEMSFEEDSGEYYPVVALLLPRLEGVASAAEVTRALRQVAEEFIGPSFRDSSQFEHAGSEIWELIGP